MRNGACSQSDYDSYKSSVHRVCDLARACTRITDFNEQGAPLEPLSVRLENNNGCINARNRVDAPVLQIGRRRAPDRAAVTESA